MVMKHPNKEIERALIELNDALCSWERSTGIESILILRENRQYDGALEAYNFRSTNGKPVTDRTISDEMLLNIIRN